MILAGVLLVFARGVAFAQDEGSIWLPAVRQDGASAEVVSPDGNLVLRLYLSNARANTGVIRFDLAYRNEEAWSTVISGGRLGLDLKSVTADVNGETSYSALAGENTHWRWQNVSMRNVRTQYAMSIAERTTIPDAYGELTLDLISISTTPLLTVQVIARVYNEGAALRYRVPQQGDMGTVRIDGEYTDFVFTQNHSVWAQASTGGHPHENEHLPATIASAPSPLENPVTIRHTADFYMALAEAAVENYPAARFVRSSSNPPAFRFDLRGAASGLLPFTTPWRVLMIAPTPGKLVEQNYLIYNLAPPSRVADTSWIKPGKAMRVGDVNNVAFAKSVVDFAVARGIEYIEFDAGWYGPENNAAYSPLSPLMTENGMIEVVDYAKQRGVGVVLYVNFIQLQRELDRIMTRYSNEWGVAGLKLGFVDGLTQSGIREILYAVQKAAQYRMFVDIHDNYCPSGMNRTWPNLFTQECVRGNEHYPGAEHNATLPFTRMLLGPADYTIAWYTDLKNVTRAHQMALSVVIFSPLKFLFWYDSPSDYQGESEVDFFKYLPSRWDETRVLEADIGNTVSIARRNGQEWFIGTITDGTARAIDLPLDFLPQGSEYTAHVYSDGGGTIVNGAQVAVTKDDILTIELPANGGNAIWLEPIQ